MQECASFTTSAGKIHKQPQMNTAPLLTQILILLTLAALSVCIWMQLAAYRRARRNAGDPLSLKLAAIMPEKPEELPEHRFLASLGSVERELVLALAEMGVREGRMEVSFLNQMLGLSAKGNDIQKVHRSRRINHINSRYQWAMDSKAVLVQRGRDEVDGRMFYYFIDDAMARAILDARDRMA